jgi:hypothetical protein
MLKNPTVYAVDDIGYVLNQSITIGTHVSSTRCKVPKGLVG